MEMGYIYLRVIQIINHHFIPSPVLSGTSYHGLGRVGFKAKSVSTTPELV